jgi:hypothetical protein
MKFFSRLFLAIALFSIGSTSKVEAVDMIYGSGVGQDPSSGVTRDSHWTIVAVPNSFTPPASQSIGYAAYVQQFIGTNWYGSNNTGFPLSTYTGFSTNGQTTYWIAAQDSVNQLAGSGVYNYNWIAAQTFNISTSGNYQFDFQGTADNFMSFFIDGTVSNTNTDVPIITGGTQIGTRKGDFTTIHNFTGTTFLTAGTHTAYMVLEDAGFLTGAIIGPSSFQAVPEPSTYALGAIASGVLATVARRRKQSAKA